MQDIEFKGRYWRLQWLLIDLHIHILLSSSVMQIRKRTSKICISIICKCAVDSGNRLRCSRFLSESVQRALVSLRNQERNGRTTKQRKATIKDCRHISDPIMSRMIGNGKACKMGNEWKWKQTKRENWCKKNVHRFLAINRIGLINQWKLVLNALTCSWNRILCQQCVLEWRYITLTKYES